MLHGGDLHRVRCGIFTDDCTARYLDLVAKMTRQIDTRLRNLDRLRTLLDPEIGELESARIGAFPQAASHRGPFVFDAKSAGSEALI